MTIAAASFAFFGLLFIGFTRVLPTVPLADVKEHMVEGHGDQAPAAQGAWKLSFRPPAKLKQARGIVARFAGPAELIQAVRLAGTHGYDQVETFSPASLRQLEKVVFARSSPVRWWTLSGALLGASGGFALAIGAANVNSLIVGAKHPVSLAPYCIVAFEGLILLGCLANLIGLLVHARLGRPAVASAYRPDFGRDAFGLLVCCSAEQDQHVRELLHSAGAEEIHAAQ